MPQQNPAVPRGNFQESLQVANIPCLLTAATTTSVFTVPTGRRFFLTAIVVHDPNGNAGSATINVGSTGTSATSLLSAQALTALGAAAATTFLQVTSWATSAPVLAGGDVITVVPGTAATGVSVMVDIIGYTI